jgi:predicted RNA-binding Zn-ribbon protein involved in translation (DUF1610 family)
VGWDEVRNPTTRYDTIGVRTSLQPRSNHFAGTCVFELYETFRTAQHAPSGLGIYQIVHEPMTKPERVVTDYTPEELETFREQFKPLAERCHRSVLRRPEIIVPMASYLIFFSLAIVAPRPLSLYFGSVVIYSVYYWVKASQWIPKCPACNVVINAYGGSFCPECGSRSLQYGGRFPRCSSCAKVLRTGIRNKRLYTIRACTTCGILLDDKGV